MKHVCVCVCVCVCLVLMLKEETKCVVCVCVCTSVCMHAERPCHCNHEPLHFVHTPDCEPAAKPAALSRVGHFLWAAPNIPQQERAATQRGCLQHS